MMRTYSHSRMTRSMEYLPLPAKAILMHLRRVIPDNETRVISQVEIARRANVGESTVSKYMPLLVSDGWVNRTAPGRGGRGNGYAITVLPPPELRPASFFEPLKGSRGADDADPFLPDPDAENAGLKGSRGDPTYHIDHDQNQQQQQSGFDSDLLQEFAGDDPQVVQEVLAKNPDLTVAEFAGQLAIATERPDVRCPRGLVFDCLRKGQRVTPARRAEPRQNTPRGARNDKKPWDTPEDLAAYFAAASAAQRAEWDGQEREPPDDMTDEERAWWHERLDAGYTSAEALNGLLTRRDLAGALPIGGAR